MSDEIKVKMDVLFGHIQIVPTYRWDGNTLIAGGYSITYDRDGKEVSRTADTETSRLICPDHQTKAMVSTMFNQMTDVAVMKR